MSDTESESTKNVSASKDDGGTEDKNLTLIQLVKEKSFLYKKADKRYSDRNLTDRAWEQIGEQLGWTRDEAREKWTRIRNNFSKVLARRDSKTRRGSAYVLYRPWIYEAELEFLKRHVTQHKGKLSSLRVSTSPAATPTPSLGAQAADSPANDPISPEGTRGERVTSDQTTPSSGWSRARASSSSRAPSDILDQATMLSYVKTVANHTEDPIVMWFKSLLPMLNTLSPQKLFGFQISTMQEIQRLTSEPEDKQEER